jgi:DNA-binding CsgD family transcriptional regulator
MVVAVRNAMTDAIRQLHRADAGRASHDDVILHDRLRSDVPGLPESGGWAARSHYNVTVHDAPRRRISLSSEGYRMANEILKPKERRVIDGVLAGKTQMEIADSIGHKQSYVSKLFRRSIQKLQDAASEELRSVGMQLQAIGRESRRAKI